MIHELRDYQENCVNASVEFFRTAKRGSKILVAGPTGSGKTIVELAIQERCKPLNIPIIAPSDDILRSHAAKLGKPEATKRELESLNLYTPVRYRNLLLKNKIPRPDGIIPDESHHWEADTGKLIDALCDTCPAIGFTASPFRGTARSTAQFRQTWGEPVWMITLKDAIKRKFVSLPRVIPLPLLDDDVIEVVNGEFTVTSTEQQVMDCFGRLVGELTRLFGGDTPDRPTMLRMPGVFSAQQYTAYLNDAKVPATCITGDSSRDDRTKAFDECIKCQKVLVQVKVVGEGVDLPIRRLVDLAPMMSPVEWLQQFGRITRPVPDGEEPPEYVCTNRNILRHAYLLEGLLPPEIYIRATELFQGPSKRPNVRAFGFEGFGKFKPVDLPLHNGTTGQMVCVTGLENNIVTEYAAIVSPLHGNPLYATRTFPRGSYNGTWTRIPELPDIPVGFASVPSRPLADDPNDKRRKWWKNAARFYGLNADAEITAKQFQCLPVLRDTGFRFRD